VIYGRIVTATGWTFETINESSAGDVFALLRYWSENPPTHDILALRYFGERKKIAPKSENEARSQLFGLRQMMDQPAMPLPPHIRAMADWAEEQKTLLNKREKGV
jgi:hypothetical protein